jgi:hypothetical protein
MRCNKRHTPAVCSHGPCSCHDARRAHEGPRDSVGCKLCGLLCVTVHHCALLCATVRLLCVYCASTVRYLLPAKFVKKLGNAKPLRTPFASVRKGHGRGSPGPASAVRWLGMRHRRHFLQPGATSRLLHAYTVCYCAPLNHRRRRAP